MSANADGLREGLRRRCDDAYLDALDRTSTELQVAAPYLTGETVDSAEVELDAAGPVYSGRVVFTTPQALWTDEGTVEHTQAGNPWIVFDVDGVTIFVKAPATVTTPARPGTRWFSDNVGPTFLAALARSFAQG